MVQVLKGLVIGMGILIVVGMGVLGYGLYKQAQELGGGGGAEPATIGTKDTKAKNGFSEALLPIPAGCKIADIKPDGDRLYIITGGPEPACARIMIVDPKNGKIMGTLKAAP